MNIKIEVSGQNGSGKSAVIQLCIEALQAKGISATCVNSDSRPRDAARLGAALSNLEELKVVFFEHQDPLHCKA